MSLSIRYYDCWSAGNGSLNLGQILMDKLDDHGAFANAGGHSLDRTVTHVAYGENSGHARFEETRIAIEGPRRGSLPIAEQVGSREDESTLVAMNQIAQPFGAWLRSDENE
jgi:hypothetical protein